MLCPLNLKWVQVIRGYELMAFEMFVNKTFFLNLCSFTVILGLTACASNMAGVSVRGTIFDDISKSETEQVVKELVLVSSSPNFLNCESIESVTATQFSTEKNNQWRRTWNIIGCGKEMRLSVRINDQDETNKYFEIVSGTTCSQAVVLNSSYKCVSSSGILDRLTRTGNDPRRRVYFSATE